MPASIRPGGGGVVDALAQGAQQHLVFGEPFDGADYGGQGAAEAIQSDNRDRVAGAHVVQKRGQAGPVVAGSGEFVGEDSFAAAAVSTSCWASRDWWSVETRAYPMTDMW